MYFVSPSSHDLQILLNLGYIYMYIYLIAMDFAKQMGFPEQNLSSSRSEAVWEQWQTDNCQPNFWEVSACSTISM